MSIYVVPKNGLKIIDPLLRDRIPEEGREVQESTYWIRMAMFGDIEIVESPPAAKKPLNVSDRSDKSGK